jgi:hypothetical protein
MGTLTTLLFTWLTSTTPVTYSVFPSSDGWAMPLPPLIDAATEEDEALNVKFMPEQVSQTYVCEFSEISAPNYRQLFLRYIDRYQMCFELRQGQENEFIIRPNQSSGMMTLTAGGWECKCASR